MFVLVDSLNEVGGDADVESAISFVGDNVNGGLFWGVHFSLVFVVVFSGSPRCARDDDCTRSVIASVAWQSSSAKDELFIFCLKRPNQNRLLRV